MRTATRATSQRSARAPRGLPPARIVAAYLEPGVERLTCGFEGGEAVTVGLAQLGLRPGEPIVWAEPDDLGAGVTLLRADGELEDCGADYIRLIGGGALPESARSESRDQLGRRVASRLKQHRTRLGLSQREMSARLEMAPPNYSRLESGAHAPSVATVARIAEALGLPLETLVRR